MAQSRALRAFLVTVVAGGTALGACFAALIPGVQVLAGSHAYTSQALAELDQLAQRSTVYDAAGTQIGQLGLENREEARLDEVPKILVDAVVATEDRTFWTNDGIDIGAVARAALTNLTSGKIEQGGSTISQQLVKNRILTPKRDINRKIREIVLALRLNDTYSKREILEQYLNTVYFGQGSYGVKSAAERFFLTADPGSPFPRGKHLSELSVGDAALLAGLISNPEGNNPFLHPKRAQKRREFVLGRMRQQGYITQEQVQAAEQEPLPTLKPSAELRPRDAWVEEVQDRLFTDPRYAVLGATEKERRDRVLTGGLKIYTTLDPGAQQRAQSAINRVLPEKPGFTAALVAMDPATGAVRAMVAGPGFEQSQYNIATSPPGRQAGSTWKAITLSTAIENGFSPDDTVSGSSPCAFGKLGQTQNAEGGGGTMTIRRATAGSVNCAFVRIQLAVGFDKIIDMAHKMGITQQTLRPYLTLTLGSIESTPLEMATVDATIANGGVHHAPFFVQRILGPDGTVVYDEHDPGERVLSPDTAACVTDLMKGVVTGGTGTAARLNGRDAAGKTGTTDSRADAWFLGFTPQLAAVVWHGNATARVPGAGFGGQIPARIWKTFMDAQLAGQPAAPFPDPGPACKRPGGSISDAGRQARPAGAVDNGTGNPASGGTPRPTPTVVVNEQPQTPTRTQRDGFSTSPTTPSPFDLPPTRRDGSGTDPTTPSPFDLPPFDFG